MVELIHVGVLVTNRDEVQQRQGESNDRELHPYKAIYVDVITDLIPDVYTGCNGDIFLGDWCIEE